jgi:hypothetical protein
MMTIKGLLKYGSIRKPAWVFDWNGLGWRGDIMNGEIQESKLVSISQIRAEELAKVLVELIKNNSKLQRAILEVVWNCPNIVTRV